MKDANTENSTNVTFIFLVKIKRRGKTNGIHGPITSVHSVHLILLKELYSHFTQFFWRLNHSSILEKQILAFIGWQWYWFNMKVSQMWNSNEYQESPSSCFKKLCYISNSGKKWSLQEVVVHSFSQYGSMHQCFTLDLEERTIESPIT